MSVLNLFPARIRWCNPDGTLTPQALRMLEVLVQRVGGTLGDVGTDMFAVPEPQPAALPDVLQQAPAAEALADMVLQPAPGNQAGADVVQQTLDYSAGTGLALANYRFSLKDTAVTPGTYGNGTNVAQVTVDQQGRITKVVNVPISGPAGANYTGSLTGKTVTVSNGLITSVA